MISRDLDSQALQLARILSQVEPRSGSDNPQIASFGAWVRVHQTHGASTVYQLVGPDEADVRQRRLSIDSPLALTLLGKKAGDVFLVPLPRGESEFTLEAVGESLNSEER